MFKKEFYSAAIYARLSREDGTGVESNSIANQISFIKDYVKSTSDIRIVSVRKDDGFSGVDFLRPDFTAMMEDIKRGAVDCVIVKDFSRFGRNHLEVAEYMEHIFPFMGVRFISINDNYDNIRPASDADHIVVPFKNLINESYLRDISIKVRSSLESKRRKGDFVANFAPYGYVRDPENRHVLAIDPYAANIVKRIFSMKISGMSQAKIAEALNLEGEPVPIDYKKMNGVNQFTPMKKKLVSEWGYNTVDRILKNNVYIGTLSQGKQTTPNFKVKKTISKPREEWAITNDAHPAIVSKSDFEIVERLLNMDSHTAPGDDEVPLFSGMLYCGDCKNSMVRKTIPSKDKKYVYYVCATNKYEKKCYSHSIQEKKLKKAVFEALKMQVQSVIDMDECLNNFKNLPKAHQKAACSSKQLEIREKELEKIKQLRKDLYEDYRADVISKEDFIQFNYEYTKKGELLKCGIEQLKNEIEVLLKGDKSDAEWFSRYKEFQEETELTRRMLVSLIEKISVYDKKKILITFYYQDKLKMLEDILEIASPCSAQLEV